MLRCKRIEFPDPIPVDRDAFCAEVARLLVTDTDGLRVDNILEAMFIVESDLGVEPGHPWMAFAHVAFALGMLGLELPDWNGMRLSHKHGADARAIYDAMQEVA